MLDLVKQFDINNIYIFIRLSFPWLVELEALLRLTGREEADAGVRKERCLFCLAEREEAEQGGTPREKRRSREARKKEGVGLCSAWLIEKVLSLCRRFACLAEEKKRDEERGEAAGRNGRRNNKRLRL